MALLPLVIRTARIHASSDAVPHHLLLICRYDRYAQLLHLLGQSDLICRFGRATQASASHFDALGELRLMHASMPACNALVTRALRRQFSFTSSLVRLRVHNLRVAGCGCCKVNKRSNSGLLPGERVMRGMCRARRGVPQTGQTLKAHWPIQGAQTRPLCLRHGGWYSHGVCIQMHMLCGCMHGYA